MTVYEDFCDKAGKQAEVTTYMGIIRGVIQLYHKSKTVVMTDFKGNEFMITERNRNKIRLL